MAKNIVGFAVLMPFFFNISLAVRVSNSETNAPKSSRLSQQERQNIIEMQKQEVPHASPKQLRPLERVSQLAAKIRQKSRSVSPRKKDSYSERIR